MDPNSPQIIVFPMTVEHVQEAVRFAVRHNLCVSVAGTGHDFINRHSCDGDGLMIRTTLLKGATWDLNDARWKGGSVTVGAGMTFSEISAEAAQKKRVIAQGWGITVGVVGWSLGGGHGPFSESLGLGADNILEAELVMADGRRLIANADENRDLWWALRGGGGSTWGVVTSLTLRAHILPEKAKLVQAYQNFGGSACPGSAEAFDASVDAIVPWLATLDARESTIVFFTPAASDDPEHCGATWSTTLVMNYIGQETDAEFLELTGGIVRFVDEIVSEGHAVILAEGLRSYDDQWQRAKEYPLEEIWPFHSPWSPSSGTPGGVASTLVARDVVASGALSDLIKARLHDCMTRASDDPMRTCQRQELYADITGNKNAPQETDVSIPPSMRSALLHFVFGQWDSSRLQEYYRLGNHSYVNESAFLIGKELDRTSSSSSSWKERLFGDKYPTLLKIKQRYDPQGIFWCRHCIGDDEPLTSTS